MFIRFCKVLVVEILILILLCGCSNATAETTAMDDVVEVAEAGLVSAVEDAADTAKKSVEEQVKEATEKENNKAEDEVVHKDEEDKIKQTEKEEQVEAECSEENTSEEEQVEEFYWDGEFITSASGVANGPSGYETYYNLPMGGVIDIMRGLGYDEESYPYWVRDDGVKMLGSYIMVAANLDIRPYGTILPCSRGMAIVCDTGTFAVSNPYQLDIAVSW